MNEEQFSKALHPISVTEFGIVIDVREVQPKNAKGLILVTESGNTKSFTNFPLRNNVPARYSGLEKLLENCISHQAAMSVILTEKSLVQLEKALSPMLAIEFGIVIEVIEEYSNALFPILVTE